MLPSRSDMNTMRLPSGDQEPEANGISDAALLVRLVGSEPSAFMTYVSRLPSRSETKGMRLPLGDHVGTPSLARLLVRRTRPEPSTFMTYISELPSRWLVKAMRLP